MMTRRALPSPARHITHARGHPPHDNIMIRTVAVAEISLAFHPNLSRGCTRECAWLRLRTRVGRLPWGGGALSFCRRGRCSRRACGTTPSCGRRR
eukprot:COSAG01_NODE_7518_length_3169_cov_5.177524_1_plen_95_part_00